MMLQVYPCGWLKSNWTVLGEVLRTPRTVLWLDYPVKAVTSFCFVPGSNDKETIVIIITYSLSGEGSILVLGCVDTFRTIPFLAGGCIPVLSNPHPQVNRRIVAGVIIRVNYLISRLNVSELHKLYLKISVSNSWCFSY